MVVIRTPRLELVPGTQATLRAELLGAHELGAELVAEIPDSWPPPLYDADAIAWMLGRLEDDPRHEEWGFRYFVRVDSDRRVALGAGGFKGPPTSKRVVEIGYSILPAFQRQGLASEAVEGLVDYSWASGLVDTVIAETLPDLRPSIGVLEKTGFELLGEGSEPGVIRFSRRPDDAWGTGARANSCTG